MMPTAMPPPPLEIRVFVKAPVPGRCKTRLARRLGSKHAARCYRAMTEHIVRQVAAMPHTRVTLLCTPDTTDPFFRRLARRHCCHLKRQSSGSLGRRMYRALADARRTGHPTIVIGSDQPDLAGAPFDTARRLLMDGHAVVAPTDDGGYWLLGLARPEYRVFSGVAWSTPRVTRQTRTALTRLGSGWHEIARRRDVDDHADWRALPRSLRLAIGRAAIMPGRRTTVT